MNNIIATDKSYPSPLDLLSILNSIDSLVYVVDMDTYELIFINKYGKEKFGEYGDQRCYEHLHKKTSPCSFCMHKYLLDDGGNPSGSYTWEFKNSRTNQWFQCRDKAEYWSDGRLVHIEIANDITELKMTELELNQAKEYAVELSRKDALTEIRNRRAIFDDSNALFKMHARFGHTVSLILIDLDFFKRINDTYGHKVGDTVLVRVAQVVQGNIRSVDLFGRIGGEEFLVVLPETSVHDAEIIAEKLRKKIEEQEVYSDKHLIKITGSFGVASSEGNALNFSMVLHNADNVLYKAKCAGRNCVRTIK